MKWLSQNLHNLHGLYINQLRMLLSAEEQILRALPTMATHSSDGELREVFRTHVKETESQIRRLNEILGEQKSADPAVDDTSPEKCKAIAGIVAEAEDMIQDARDAWVRDAALIAAAQRVEHYEIASYGTVRQWAYVLDENKAADLLDLTIKEEGHADHLLTAIAERLNPKAKAA